SDLTHCTWAETFHSWSLVRIYLRYNQIVNVKPIVMLSVSNCRVQQLLQNWGSSFWRVTQNRDCFANLFTTNQVRYQLSFTRSNTYETCVCFCFCHDGTSSHSLESE